MDVFEILLRSCLGISGIVLILIGTRILLMMIFKKESEPGMKIVRWNRFLGRRVISKNGEGTMGVIPIIHKYEIVPFSNEWGLLKLKDLEIKGEKGPVRISLDVRYQ